MGIRRAATTAAVTAGALGTATLGLSPPAEATCASLFGFSTDPARCSSSALGIAVAIGDGPADVRDHRRAPAARSRACSGPCPAWQIAAARASAAWSGLGGTPSPSTAPTISCTWRLSARP